ncbi:MAG: phage portal protein [Hyphomicrobium sp. 32-62-53]|nr:MAG: phage portal protein [Hyphomicrobium sp. 12-62-95]OYY01435.1 MAG: phage portal protein [Hyphomicrobium sp. 32-62-53]
MSEGELLTPPDRVRVPMAAAAGIPGRTSHTAASYTDQNIALWRPPLRSADGDTLRDAGVIRARARDLVRNHPYAKMAVRASSIGVVGKRLRYSCRPDYKFLGIDHEEAVRWGQEFERVWEAYAHGPEPLVDAGKRMSFSQFMRLAHRMRFVDGEALATMEWAPGYKWRSCAQLVDCDRLSNPNGKPDSAYLKSGVALSDLSEPIAYYIRHGHPGDFGLINAETLKWSEISRRTAWGRRIVMHSYDLERAAQTRGVSALASTIVDMKMGREFVETSLQQAILQASYAAVLVSQQNYKDALEIIAGMSPDKAKTVTDLAIENLEAAAAFHESAQLRFNGSKVPMLFPGEDLKLLTPGNKGASLAEFQSQSVKAYAAGMGVNPVSVSQDYSNVNYSSAKMASADSWRHYEVMREDLIGDIAMPMVDAFLEEVFHSGALELPKGIKPFEFYDAKHALIKGVFLTQGAPNLDPVKEAQAAQMEIAMGAKTLQDICAENGEDYLDKLDQQAAEQKARAVRGLVPVAMPAAAPAKDEPTDKPET